MFNTLGTVLLVGMIFRGDRMMQREANVFARIVKTVGAAIQKIEAKPSVPAGVYFGIYMVSWVVAALSATHLVDSECRLLAWLMPSSTFMYEDVCRGMEYVVLAAGVVVVVVVPFVLLCARRFRASLKTILIGFVGIVASIAFSFLTEDMLFFVSLIVDNDRKDAMRNAAVELREE